MICWSCILPLEKCTAVKMIFNGLLEPYSNPNLRSRVLLRVIRRRWTFSLQAWKQNIKAMWYTEAFVNFLIWKADTWDSPFVLCDFDIVKRSDRWVQHWFMSILTCNMTREHYIDPQWPAGWSAVLGGDEIGNKAFR